jgi:hypothetical protein
MHIKNKTQMKYYQNKTTGEIIGVENMRQLITHPTEQSTKLGFIDHSYMVVYDMICPNNLLGNGIKSYSITHSYLKTNYKRIKMEIAFKKHPNFRQYRFDDLQKESALKGIPTLDVLHKQRF